MIKKLILWFPVLLPAYLLRIKLGPFPTTALELAFVALAIVVTWKKGWGIWQAGFANTRPWHGPAALWIIATAIAIVIAPKPSLALGLWRAYVLLPMLYAILLAGTMREETDRRDVVMALVASVTFIAGWSALQFLGFLPIPHPWDTDIWTRRATGPFPFPNAVSLFCVPIVALCIGILSHPSNLPFVRGGSHWRTILLVGFFSGTLATILAKSVGGFLAILAVSLIALIWNQKTRTATIIASLLLAIIIAMTPHMRAPIVSSLTFNEWSGKVRLILWRETWAMLKDTSTPLGAGRPIFGAGFGAYRDVIVPYHRATAIEIFQYPHNLLLNLWSETGLLGLAAFGWICVVWIRSCLRHERPQGSPLLPTAYRLLPLIAILIHGLVDVPYFKNDLAFLFWIFAVLTIRFPTPLPV